MTLTPMIFTLLAALAIAQQPASLEDRSRDVLGWTLDSPKSTQVLQVRETPRDASAWQALLQQARSRTATVIVVPSDSRLDASVLQSARSSKITIALSGDPARSFAAVSGLGPEAAIWATPAEWTASGVSPLAALSIVKSRLAGGALAAGPASDELLKEAYRLDLRPLLWTLPESGSTQLRNTIEALISYHQSYAARTEGTRRLAGVSPEERAKIEAALPPQAPAQPKKPRKLLVFDLNVGRFGHPSIPHANLAMQLMGKKTGAFEATVSSDPAILEPARLAEFDAVFLNNTIGDIFATPQARDAFSRFIANGGGLMANHAATVTATSWPEFGEILGARGASHRMTDERVRIQIEDPDNPVVRTFDGAAFEFSDEIFRFQAPYSREKVRVLLSVDAARTDMMQGRCYGQCLRDDNDYPVAWVRGHGKGRVFYTTLGHNPAVFQDRRMLAMFLAAAQYVLGDLPAVDSPRPRSFPGLDSALAELSRYDFGKDRTPVRRFEREMALVLSSPEASLEVEKKLLSLLESDAPLGAKETVCRQLAFMGSEASRPVLESMLRRRETEAIARYALHGLTVRPPRPPVSPGLPAGPDPARFAQLESAAQAKALHSFAMAGRRDLLPLLLSSLDSPSPEVRIAALRSMVELGGAAQVPVLIRKAASSPDAEQSAARFVLVRMPSEEVDRALAVSVASLQGRERLESIRALGERGYPGAAQPLLAALSDNDPSVRREAARAIKEIARPEHAPPLLERMESAPAGDWRYYETAVTAALRRSANPDAAPVVQAYERSTNPAFRQTMLSVLGQVGSPASLPAVRGALNNSDPEIQRAAAKALSEWPTAEPIGDLLQIAQTSKVPAIQALSLRGFVRLVQFPSERTPAASVKLLEQALAVSSRPEEKRVVLSALQRLPVPESLEVVKRAESDPSIAPEARNAAAIIERNLAARPD